MGQVKNQAASRVNQPLAGSLVTDLGVALVSFVMQQKTDFYSFRLLLLLHVQCVHVFFVFHMSNEVHCYGDTCSEHLSTGLLRHLKGPDCKCKMKLTHSSRGDEELSANKIDGKFVHCGN